MGKQKLVKGKPKKGGVRTEHGEQKERCNLSLTPTAIASLDRIATALGISRSELVERIARADEAAIMELARGSHGHVPSITSWASSVVRTVNSRATTTDSSESPSH